MAGCGADAPFPEGPGGQESAGEVGQGVAVHGQKASNVANMDWPPGRRPVSYTLLAACQLGSPKAMHGCGSGNSIHTPLVAGCRAAALSPAKGGRQLSAEWQCNAPNGQRKVKMEDSPLEPGTHQRGEQVPMMQWKHSEGLRDKSRIRDLILP